MATASEQVGELSRMKRELNKTTLESLEGNRIPYVDRLSAVADATFLNNAHVDGTTVTSPGALVRGKRGRFHEVTLPRDKSMYVREIPTPQGKLSMFPLHSTGLTMNGVPIIDPDIDGSYTVVHLPSHDGVQSSGHSPSDMRADLLFTVDSDNLITVDGQNVATQQERVLFDAIVREFERLASLEQPE